MELFIGWWAAAIILNNFSTKKVRSNDRGMTFVAFTSDVMPDTLVVDCSHLTAKQLTHHLKGPNQKKKMDLSLRGDSSTDAVLNSIKCQSQFTDGLKHVSSNHFDVDSFTASWCCIYPDLAAKYDQTVREISRIGDFRELRLDHPYQHTALQLTCWLNSEERRLFYKPFESKISKENGELDGVVKFEHFLPIFGDVLDNPEQYRDQWIEEYERVLSEYSTINSSPTCHDQSLGLICVESIDPTHYYSLFSTSRGFDIILALYSGNRYELEMKYTSMIDLGSRPTLPRVDMTPLAKYLNILEKEKSEEEKTESYDRKTGTEVVTDPNEEVTQSLTWHCDRITDSGPILRLNSDVNKLSKSARYGHPYERPIYSSLISPSEMKETVFSFFSHAYSGGTDGRVHPKKDHEWCDLHDFNKRIDWSLWRPSLHSSSSIPSIHTVV